MDKQNNNAAFSSRLAINKCANISKTDIEISASKSESNRCLIINALASDQGTLHNISEARDTQTMQRLLNDDGEEWNVLDAGTTMRFLTAFAAVKDLKKVLTGTERMQQRPIKILVDALEKIGADISYLKKDGYPPLKINSFREQLSSNVDVRGDVSSQYISALMMIAPVLPKGLKIELTGKIGSRPYIEMTMKLMHHFGAEITFEDREIVVGSKPYQAANYTIESDWSGASYWYSMVALADGLEGNIKLKGLRKSSFQGDRVIAEIMENLGVKTIFEDDGVSLSKTDMLQHFSYDFTNCPDLAQTVAVCCSVKGVACEMTGLESLRIKETDRISALQNELAKINADLVENFPGSWKVSPSEIISNVPISISTYEDHRMAMAFAPLATQIPITIEDPSVVNKSYPRFWEHMKQAGFTLNFD